MSDDQSRPGEDGGGTDEDVERPGAASGPAGVAEGEDGADREGADGEVEDDSVRGDQEGEEWKFSLSDIEEREADAEEAEEVEDHRAPEPNSTSIVRGSPSVENALFVALGMLVMVGVLVRLVGAGIGV